MTFRDDQITDLLHCFAADEGTEEVDYIPGDGSATRRITVSWSSPPRDVTASEDATGDEHATEVRTVLVARDPTLAIGGVSQPKRKDKIQRLAANDPWSEWTYGFNGDVQEVGLHLWRLGFERKHPHAMAAQR